MTHPQPCRKGTNLSGSNVWFAELALEKNQPALLLRPLRRLSLRLAAKARAGPSPSTSMMGWGGRTRDSHKLPRISLRLVISPATTCHSSSSSPISLHLLYLPNSGSAGALLNGYRGHLLPPGAETALCSRKPAPLFTLLGPAELGHRMAREPGSAVPTTPPERPLSRAGAQRAAVRQHKLDDSHRVHGAAGCAS